MTDSVEQRLTLKCLEQAETIGELRGRTADLERCLAKIAKACLAPVSNDARIDLVQDALIGLGIRELIDARTVDVP